jgi:hypothetical protein
MVLSEPHAAGRSGRGDLLAKPQSALCKGRGGLSAQPCASAESLICTGRTQGMSGLLRARSKAAQNKTQLITLTCRTRTYMKRKQASRQE